MQCNYKTKMETMVMIFACKASWYNYIRQQKKCVKQFELKYLNLVYLENGNSKIIFEVIYLDDDRYQYYRNLVKRYIKTVCMGNLECLTDHLF